MKTIIVLFVFLLISVRIFAQLESIFAQRVEQQPIGQINSPWGIYITAGPWLAVDSRENTYVTANTGAAATTDIDGIFSNYLLPFVGSSDLFVASYRPNGSVRWGWTLNSSSTLVSTGIVVDNFDHVWLSGIFDGPVDLDPGPDTMILSPASNYEDFFIAEYDSNGTFIRAMQITNTPAGLENYFYNMVFDQHNNLIIAGFYEGILDVDPGPLLDTLPRNNNFDNGFVAKYDSAMHLLNAWTLQSFTGPVRIMDFQIDDQDNLYLTGEFQNSLDFDPGPANHTLTTSYKSSFVAKYNSQDSLLWVQKTMNELQSQGIRICVTPDHRVIMGGKYSGNIYFPTIHGDTTFLSWSGGFWDLNSFLVAYNDTGGVLWARNLPQTSWESAVFQIKYLKSDSSIFTPISVIGSLNVDVGHTNTTYNGNGTWADVALVNYNSNNGDYQYSCFIPSISSSYDNDIFVKEGKLYMTHQFKDSIDVNLGFGSPQYMYTNNTSALLVGSYCIVPRNIYFSIPGDTLEVCPNAPVVVSAIGAERFEWYDSLIGGSLISSSDTIQFTTGRHSFSLYTVGINSNCRSTRKQLFIRVSPQVNITEDSVSACAEDSVLLHFLGTGDLFSTNYPDAFTTGQLLSQSEYVWVQETDTMLGCMIRDSAFVMIHPLPVVNLNVYPDTVCISNLAALSGGTPSGGNYSGTGVSGGIFHPMSTGLGYTWMYYTYIDSAGCSNTAVDSMLVEDCLSINQPYEQWIRIQENPVSRSILLNGTLPFKLDYQLFDIMGRLVKSGSYLDNGIFVGDVVAGEYLLSLYAPSFVKNLKVLKLN